jgi:ubiquinone/menaquinone biosynthesis C-methylase UbiE
VTALAAERAHDDFWSQNQPGVRFTDLPVGTAEFFAEVERYRYALEPHIPGIVNFQGWQERDVLEVGCGLGTDGLRFGRAGARYVGVDQSAAALDLADRRFQMDATPGRFVQAPANDLPFEDESVDLVFSHGVVHHLPDTRGAIDEFRRVLRPGGTALVMVYHRRSFNYLINIMVIRRLLAALLLVPGAGGLLSRLTGERREVLDGHRRLLAAHGRRYLMDAALFLSNNTDGPGNPLSKAYSHAEAAQLFSAFDSVTIQVRYLNLRVVPGGQRFARTALARRLERRVGWHLYIRAKKAP